jgi:ABC-type multidrug transport system ATPase subunit
VEENIRFFASVFKTTLSANYDLVKSIYSHIEPFKNRKAGALSGGMKQKLALSCALIHKPKILLLDEPTTGVDAVSRREFWQMLKDLKKQDITIIVSTPYMDEASLCERVSLLHSGRILITDQPEGIKKQFSKNLFEVLTDDKYNMLKTLRKHPVVQTVNTFGQSLHFVTENTDLTENDLSYFIRSSDITEFSVKKSNPEIEDCFIDLCSDNKR